jgi:hypothetical protein
MIEHPTIEPMDTLSHLQAGHQWLRAFGFRSAGRVLPAWHRHRAVYSGDAAYHREMKTASLLMIFSFSGLAFTLFAIERFPSLVAAMSACP